MLMVNFAEMGIKVKSYAPFAALVDILLLLVSDTSAGIVITPEPNTVIILKNVDQTSNCTVCTASNRCSVQVTLKSSPNISLEFTCPQPQNVFRVEITREIMCTNASCKGDIGKSESSLFPEFNRTFNWDLKGQPSKGFQVGFQVDFPASGMHQIPPSKTCPDQRTYTIILYQRIGPVTIGTFCKDGLVRTIQMLYKARVSLKLPGSMPLEPSIFDVAVGPDIKTLAEIFTQFPYGSSDITLFSPNYPRDFPDDDLVTWTFSVPPKHNYTVRFLEYTEPRCLKKRVDMEYEWLTENFFTGLSLSDPQPAQRQGNFKMSLRNCEVDRSNQGLSLNFQVSVTRSSYPMLCSVDLQEEEGLTVYIKKTDPSSSTCEMKLDSVNLEGITMQSGRQFNLSFQDCGSADILLTVNKSIDLMAYPPEGILLTIPVLDPCLATRLRSVTWNLWSSKGGTLELMPPADGFRQSLPGQECSGSVSLAVTDAGGAPVGTFCSAKGPIHRVKLQANSSVMAKPTGNAGLRQMTEALLNVSFSPEITEGYTFTVHPVANSLTWLATPSWPDGMQPRATASWLVSLPPEHQAKMLLVNISQPRCGTGQALITAHVPGLPPKSLGPGNSLIATKAFYLNVTNCDPKEGDFSVLSKVTLQKNSSHLLEIILGALGVLLLTLVLVVLVVCIVKRRKKGRKRVSIYNPNGNVFNPGHTQFKSREDGEFHVYDSIKESSGHGKPWPAQVDMYQTFSGLVDSDPQAPFNSREESEMETFQPYLNPGHTAGTGKPHPPVLRQDSLAYTNPRMVDNELCTFRNNEDTGLLFLPVGEREQGPDSELEEGKSEEGWE